jgi:hypothetical protein
LLGILSSGDGTGKRTPRRRLWIPVGAAPVGLVGVAGSPCLRHERMHTLAQLVQHRAATLAQECVGRAGRVQACDRAHASRGESGREKFTRGAGAAVACSQG